MFKRLFMMVLLLPALCFSAETFVAGKDYEVLTANLTSEPHKKVVVTEFFNYGCPACFRIESVLNQWLKLHEKDINFSRIPVVFNKEWIYYAKAYYAANLLGISDTLGPILFKAIQTEKRPLSNNQAMIDFFVAQGVDKETAQSAFTQSTTLDMKINESNVMMGRMHINAVPAIVVNHTYKTDLQMAKDETRLFKILDYLLTK